MIPREAAAFDRSGVISCTRHGQPVIADLGEDGQFSLPWETTMKMALESNQCASVLKTIKGMLNLYGN